VGYDTPARPTDRHHRRGKRIKAVAQVTKQAFLYVFDRVTGKPVWPIEEQPCPASSVPGEARVEDAAISVTASPDRHAGRARGRSVDFTPELRKEAIESSPKYDHGPLFTAAVGARHDPVPGVAGGGNWAGAAIDPETGMLYVGTYRLPFVVTVRKPRPAESTTITSASSAICPGRAASAAEAAYGSMLAIDMNSGEHRCPHCRSARGE
jgi:quinoprotein glucose dehydrogenase